MSDAPPGKPPYVLAIDVGTSSTRSYLYDRGGSRLGGAKIRHDWRTTPDGGFEADADVLLARTMEAIDRAVGVLPGAEIAAVGMATFWHGLLGVDAGGNAITPVYAWSDTRAASAAEELRRRLNEQAVHARTGAVFHPAYLPARLLWISRAHPRRFARVRWWISAGEYLALRLFGESAVSISIASGTGLFDQDALQWDERLIDELPISPAQLSPIVDVDHVFRGLREPYASRWPTLRAVPWLPAIGDGAASNIGSGCIDDASIALSLGTSGALRILAPARVATHVPGLWRYRLDAERVLVGGAISNGGSVYRWMRERLRLPSMDETETALAELPPDAHGLTMLPFFTGERSPDWPLNATAALVGATHDTSPFELVHAGLEAVAYRLASIRDLLAQAFPDTHRVVGSGGALRASPAWVRIIADVFGEPVFLSSVGETSSRGAALLALRCARVLPDIAHAPVPVASAVEPDLDRHARYRNARARQKALAELLASWQPVPAGPGPGGGSGARPGRPYHSSPQGRQAGSRSTETKR